jgi:hypothetical protein
VLVNTLVVTAEEEPPKIVDDPTIVVMVEPPLVKVEKRTVVVMADDATEAEEPEPWQAVSKHIVKGRKEMASSTYRSAATNSSTTASGTGTS